MGSKSSSAPAPDPELIKAQIKSMGYQDEMIQRIIANSDEMAPIQREQSQFALDTSRIAWDQAQEDRQWFNQGREQLRGLQNQLVADAQDFNTERRREELAGQARGDVSQAFGLARDTNTRQLQRMGVNPNDGRSIAMGSQLAMAEAAATANAANKTREAARLEGLQLTDRATNALAGYPAQGMQATGAGAGYGLSGLGAANSTLAGLNSGYGAAGQLSGQMGSNATSMWGAQANYHTANQSQETTGGLLGGLLGSAAAGVGIYKAMSDRRTKTAIRQIGVDAGTQLPLYIFCYRTDPSMVEWIGVMSDDVRKTHPEAVTVADDGFDRVDYGMLGIEMKRVAFSGAAGMKG